jgi:hypothetical protein
MSAADMDEFLVAQAHPLDSEIRAVRAILLGVSPSIVDDIKWNSVSFRNSNDYFVTLHLRSQSSLQLILFTGVKKKQTAVTGVPVEDPHGIIERWAAKDRCVVSLGAGDAFEANREALVDLVTSWIRFV